MGWGEKLEDDIGLDPPSMRQAIAWSFALRNIRRAETEEAGERLLRSSGADSVRDVKARPAGIRTLMGRRHARHGAEANTLHVIGGTGNRHVSYDALSTAGAVMLPVALGMHHQAPDIEKRYSQTPGNSVAF